VAPRQAGDSTRWGPLKHRRAAASYAKALFELAKERDQTELVGRELGDLAAILEGDRALRDFFARPWTPPAVKRTVAMEVAQGSGLSKLTSDFVTLVAGRGRTDHIDAIAERYGKLLDEHFGRVRARVRSTVPLTDEERRTLSAKIGQALRSRQVLLDEIIDPTMLGGFVVETRGIVLDGSLEGQLDRIRRRLGTV